MKRKILFIIMAIFSFMLFTKGVYAASASITASKTSVTVGTKVTITVKVNAAAWNLNVSGDASGSIVGFNAEAENQATTKTYTLKPTKAGKYTVYLTGDITDESSETATNINKSVTVTVKEKTTTNTNTNNNTTTNTNNNTTTTTTKSSNANISKLTLSVEGLSFKSSQTTYNIKVGEDVDNITVGVTLSHKKATYTVTGNKNLKAGNNVIKIVVTAEDGTKKTYKINVEKEGNVEESSADLANLIIEDMTFETPFNTTETEYVGSKMKYAESLNVLPYTVSEKATYEIIGNENLKEGQNTIVVKVTSADKRNTVEYKVTFEMESKEETNALQVVNPYIETEPQVEQQDESNSFKEIIMEHSTIILLYLLALVEFAQVVYLYVQLKNVDPNSVTVRRRNGNK
ncbi:MAG: cadherin-like beta sandwich domain-containing protein [Clostridia bacterium]|nr:cadherin-like beta sandwich domain-containing protein [Clostridia bacterium]